MHKYLLLLFSLSISLSIFGQSHFGLRSNLGLSRLFDHSDPSKYAPMVNGGFFYEIALRKKSILGIETMFTQIIGKHKYENTLATPTASGHQIIGHLTTNENTNISYLSFPLYYGIKLNRLQYNLGLVPSYNLVYTIKRKDVAIVNGIEKTTSTKKKSFYLNHLELGTKFSIAYQLNDRIQLEAKYYLAISMLYESELINPERIDQTTRGIRYALNKQE